MISGNVKGLKNYFQGTHFMLGLSKLSPQKKTNMAILVAALGYFVDVYDLTLFGVVRVSSLNGIGVTGEQALSAGVTLLNWQMIGMLIGGLVWGVWGDKRGRVQVLFGSILIYSIANIGNAFVTTIPQYSAMRFIAGFGLAGEVGAGITLVSEILSKERRGWCTTLVATFGGLGAITAALVGDFFDWRTSYIIGGVMGLVLLCLRVSVHESGVFKSITDQAHIKRGNFLMIFTSKERVVRYLSCISIAVPVWFIVGVLMIFSPELGKALGLSGDIKSPTTALCWTIGITLGDIGSGVLSQLIRSRKRVIRYFLIASATLSALILNMYGASPATFYGISLALGFAMGYWAVFLTTAAEQFGTNLRSTVTSTVPNVVRGSAVLITLLFTFLKPTFGFIGSAWIVGTLCFGLSAIGLYLLRETYGIDLNFVEGGKNQKNLDVASKPPELKHAQGS